MEYSSNQVSKLRINILLSETLITLTLRKGEIPSANGNCSARGLAKVAAMMANKGTFEGKTLLSPQTWEEMHLNPTDGILVQKSVKVGR